MTINEEDEFEASTVSGWIIEMLGDGFTTAGIAGQNDIAAYVAFGAMDVKLLFGFLHSDTPLF